eukprot:GEMP01083072.1.p2 GENE.GEMP01083072.1~~GEMP01083072.1.p2  ORF type:complete len:115 (+),score=29.20 GEMP01083072.1:76-420(+)
MVVHFSSYLETIGAASAKLNAAVFDLPVKEAAVCGCCGIGSRSNACKEITVAIYEAKNYAEASYTADAGTVQQHVMHVHSEAANKALNHLNAANAVLNCGKSAMDEATAKLGMS